MACLVLPNKSYAVLEQQCTLLSNIGMQQRRASLQMPDKRVFFKPSRLLLNCIYTAFCMVCDKRLQTTKDIAKVACRELCNSVWPTFLQRLSELHAGLLSWLPFRLHLDYRPTASAGAKTKGKCL